MHSKHNPSSLEISGDVLLQMLQVPMVIRIYIMKGLMSLAFPTGLR
jgi:hypothetical protein